MTVGTRALLAVAFGAALGGCGGNGPAPVARVQTGAEEAAKQFFEAVARQDWAAAYGLLTPDSRARCDRKEFTRRAEAFVAGLGFEPTEARVTTCDERGDEAVAHLSLKGLVGSSSHFQKEMVVMRRTPSGWGVVLPDHFGKPRPRQRAPARP